MPDPLLTPLPKNNNISPTPSFDKPPLSPIPKGKLSTGQTVVSQNNEVNKIEQDETQKAESDLKNLFKEFRHTESKYYEKLEGLDNFRKEIKKSSKITHHKNYKELKKFLQHVQKLKKLSESITTELDDYESKQSNAASIDKAHFLATTITNLKDKKPNRDRINDLFVSYQFLYDKLNDSMDDKILEFLKPLEENLQINNPDFSLGRHLLSGFNRIIEYQSMLDRMQKFVTKIEPSGPNLEEVEKAKAQILGVASSMHGVRNAHDQNKIKIEFQNAKDLTSFCAVAEKNWVIATNPILKNFIIKQLEVGIKKFKKAPLDLKKSAEELLKSCTAIHNISIVLNPETNNVAQSPKERINNLCNLVLESLNNIRISDRKYIANFLTQAIEQEGIDNIDRFKADLIYKTLRFHDLRQLNTTELDTFIDTLNEKVWKPANIKEKNDILKYLILSSEKFKNIPWASDKTKEYWMEKVNMTLYNLFTKEVENRIADWKNLKGRDKARIAADTRLFLSIWQKQSTDPRILAMIEKAKKVMNMPQSSE